ncbi:hypothetical protein [Postechiella marina]|uniref:hypothetical protein n=1 Tax=Postechiella marina TaxID=943941 RepID=UPI0031D6E855
MLVIILVLPLLTTNAHEKHKLCDLGIHHKDPYSVMCDLCGCSTSSGSFGFGTLSNANFIGLRYIYQNFESKDGIFANSPVSKETFNTYQLWAQLPINESFYVSANLPYQDLKRKREQTTEHLKGVGDASVIGWYKLQFYKKEKDSLTYNLKREPSGHSLQFGIGAKLPTGEFEEALTNNVNPGFQVGTGSFDGVFSMGYNYGTNKFGVNTLITYYVKGENKNDYQFGNQFSYSANFFTSFSREKYNIMPFVGISGDTYNSIKQYGETLADTDGNILNSTIGSELALEKFIFGINYTLPISQDLFGGNVESKNRLSLYVNFAL